MSKRMRFIFWFCSVLAFTVHTGCITEQEQEQNTRNYFAKQIKDQNPSFKVPHRLVCTNTLTRSDLVGRWEGSRDYEQYMTIDLDPDYLKNAARVFTTLTLNADGAYVITEEWTGGIIAAERTEGAWKFHDGTLSLWAKGIHTDYSVIALDANRFELVQNDLSAYKPSDGRYLKYHSLYNDCGCLCTLGFHPIRSSDFYFNVTVLGPQLLERAIYKRTDSFVSVPRQELDGGGQGEYGSSTESDQQAGNLALAQTIATQAAQVSQSMSTISTPTPAQTVVTPRVTTPTTVTPLKQHHHLNPAALRIVTPRAPSFGWGLDGNATDR